jgi:hypothetical protein
MFRFSARPAAMIRISDTHPHLRPSVQVRVVHNGANTQTWLLEWLRVTGCSVEGVGHAHRCVNALRTDLYKNH